MGWLNVYAVTCGLGCAYVAHTLLDTPYDWAILWLLVVAVAWVYPDEPLTRLEAMARWVYKK